MWIYVFGFIVLGWVILKNEKNFNKSIQTLENRINNQQTRIQELEMELDELKRR